MVRQQKNVRTPLSPVEETKAVQCCVFVFVRRNILFVFQKKQKKKNVYRHIITVIVVFVVVVVLRL